MKVIYADEYLQIVPQEQSKYRIVLQGSYEYMHYSKSYAYQIENIEPNIPLSVFYSKEFLFSVDAWARYAQELLDADCYFRLKHEDNGRWDIHSYQRPNLIENKEYEPYFEHFENLLRIDKNVSLQNLSFMIEFYFAAKCKCTLYVLHAFELFLKHKQKK